MSRVRDGAFGVGIFIATVVVVGFFVLPIVAITPLVIIPFSTYLEGERPTVRSLVGGVIAVAGAVALAKVGHG